MDVSRKKIPVMHMMHTIDMYVKPPIRLSLSINEEKVWNFKIVVFSKF